MPRRREFKGIVKNLAELLSGRNNDYLGYWGVGQLFLLDQEHGVDTISLDLIICKGDISSPLLADMCQSMKSEMNRILNAHKLPSEWVKSVSAKFSFNQEYQEKYHYWRSSLGKPYLVQVEIETDLGYVNKATQGGNVKPHDPSKEQRRGGF
ncbi:hypothetical protein [Pseudoalteromonas piscicida]|uniref:Uncharacterized protein n=1 Tax=Pseudoalteromonas piscicida TaxID=43662 RepID=A0A2A5JSJ7_PSEO7|nr:hypothetical protein [Pseudoalteromonas piscicida]PCK32385.1 hypothetical protein CEX98_07325 [Pseudoalteromonas piscicida]